MRCWCADVLVCWFVGGVLLCWFVAVLLCYRWWWCGRWCRIIWTTLRHLGIFALSAFCSMIVICVSFFLFLISVFVLFDFVIYVVFDSCFLYLFCCCCCCFLLFCFIISVWLFPVFVFCLFIMFALKEIFGVFCFLFSCQREIS